MEKKVAKTKPVGQQKAPSKRLAPLAEIGLRSSRDAVRGNFEITKLRGSCFEIMVPGSSDHVLWVLELDHDGSLRVSTGAVVLVQGVVLDHGVRVEPLASNAIMVTRRETT